MMKSIRPFVIAAMLLLHAQPSFASSPFEGQWITFDDETRRAKSVVTIEPQADGTLTGTVTRILLDAYRNEVCLECTGEQKGQKIEGIQFLWGMKKASGSKYDEGTILDPQTGKTYTASMTLLDGGKKLDVRGYMGFSLLGRSQTWEKAQKAY